MVVTEMKARFYLQIETLSGRETDLVAVYLKHIIDFLCNVTKITE